MLRQGSPVPFFSPAERTRHRLEARPARGRPQGAGTTFEQRPNPGHWLRLAGWPRYRPNEEAPGLSRRFESGWNRGPLGKSCTHARPELCWGGLFSSRRKGANHGKDRSERPSKRVWKTASPLRRVAKSIGMGLYKSACAAKIDGEVKDLRTPIDNDCSLEILTFDSPEGKHAYWHTASHILAQAVQRLYPGTKFAIARPSRTASTTTWSWKPPSPPMTCPRSRRR